MAVPLDLATLRAHVDDALLRYVDIAEPRVVGMDARLAEPLAELRAFVTGGGKRLRPTSAILGYAAAGGDDLDAVLGPALALELLHTCALLHDDIIDDAPTRRGRPTSHAHFASVHADAGWDGASAAYGAAVAILLGDLAFVQADELFFSSTTTPEVALAGFGVFTTLREEVMAGQYLDLQHATTRGRDAETAMRIASLKSGRYSIARPLQLGAVLAGGDDELCTGLLRFGDPLGRAFQLRDDLLGVFGDEETTGKSAASDLVEGKRTYLVAATLERLDPGEAVLFESLLGRPDLDPDGAEELREMMRSSGGLEATRDRIETERLQATAALDELVIPEEARSALHELAEFIVRRRA